MEQNGVRILGWPFQNVADIERLQRMAAWGNMSEKVKITAVLVPLDERAKYYGTEIQLYRDTFKLGNPLKIWFSADNLGGHAPSGREKEPEIHGQHYESQADLHVATKLVELINAQLIVDDLPDDHDDVW